MAAIKPVKSIKAVKLLADMAKDMARELERDFGEVSQIMLPEKVQTKKRDEVIKEGKKVLGTPPLPPRSPAHSTTKAQKYRAKLSLPVPVHSEEFRSKMENWKRKARQACLSSERIHMFELAVYGELDLLDRPLQTLDFSSMEIESWQLTSEFSAHEALSLDFSGNNIDRIPKEFLSRLDNVRQLKFASNEVTKLPVKFGETLKNLEQLDLRCNHIYELPDDFGKFFEKLVELDLSRNHLIELPDDFGKCFPDLKILHLNSNELEELPEDFGSNLKNLDLLNLSWNRLIRLPNDFGRWFPELQGLYLDHNRLTSLPNGFGSLLKKLKELDLSDNKLGDLLTEFADWFSELVYLNLQGNNLKSLPEELGSRLRKLEKLDLSRNKLTELPQDFSKWFPELISLDLQDNELKSLPEELGSRLRKLVKLDLSGNKIKYLPVNFGKGLSSLKTLKLENNEIKSLPKSVMELKAVVNIEGNPTAIPSYGIGKESYETVQRHLFEHISDQTSDDIYEPIPEQIYEIPDLKKNPPGHIFEETYDDISGPSPAVPPRRRLILPSWIRGAIKKVSDVINWYPYEDIDEELYEVPQVSDKNVNKDQGYEDVDNDKYESMSLGMYGENSGDVYEPMFEIEKKITEKLAEVNLESKAHATSKRLPVTTKGGLFVCDCLGVRLDIPMNTLNESTAIELSEKPIDEVHIDLSFGESCLSHVISLGPDEIRFSKPCKLTIPYNLHEEPPMTNVLVKHFSSSQDKWVSLPTNFASKSSEDGKLIQKLAQVEIQEAGLYAVCLVLESVQFTVFSDESLSLYPFGEDIGVKLRFESGTFPIESLTCTAKVNIFTNEAITALQNRGITASPILHIETASGLPEKPVEIKLPFRQVDGEEGNIYVLQGDNDVFEDITDSSNYKLQDGSVILQVHHFSLVVVVRSVVSDFLEILKTYVSGARDAAFYLYGIKDEQELSCCIASSLVEDNENVNEWFKDTPFTLIDKCQSNKGLYCGTVLKFDVLGQMRSNFVIELLFSFSRQKLRVTETFTLVEKNHEHQQEIPQENYIYILGRDDGVKYAQVAYWRLLQNRKTDIHQPVVLIKQEYHMHEQHQHEYHQHVHEHKHENKIENKIDFTTNVHDGSTAIVGEIKADIKDFQVLQIANFGAQDTDQQRRALEIRDSAMLEIEPKKD